MATLVSAAAWGHADALQAALHTADAQPGALLEAWDRVAEQFDLGCDRVAYG